MKKIKSILAVKLAALLCACGFAFSAWADTAPEVAQIGDNKYATLAEAIIAAQDGDTILLIEDEELSSTLEITKSITLDLGGHTLTKTLASTGDTTPMIKALSGTVAINNGSITYDLSTYTGTGSTSNANLLKVGMNMSNGIYSYGDCNLTLNGINANVTFPGGKANMTMVYVESGRVNIVDSNFVATTDVSNKKTQYIIYTTTHSQAQVNAYVSISGTSVIGTTNSQPGIHAIWLQGANDTLVISGNDVSVYADATWKPNSYSTSYGYAVNNQSGATCTIEGGRFKGKVWQNKGAVTVSGGYFNYAQGTSGQKNKVTVAEGYVFTDNTDPVTAQDYPYVVRPDVPSVAQIGEIQYETLQAAIAAAQSGDTVELLTDIQLSGTEQVAINKVGDYVIDGKGHTISPAADSAYVYERFKFGMDGETPDFTKNYTVTNLTITGFSDSTYFIRNEGCSTTFVDCTITNNNLSAQSGSRLVLATASNLTMKDFVVADNATASYLVDFNTNGSANGTVGTLDIDGCLFSGNTAGETAIIYSYGSSSGGDKIRNSTFTGNTVNSAAAAMVYMSGATDIAGCLFTNNTVTATNSTQKCGVLALGSGAAGSEYTGNAFVNNTLTAAGHVATIYGGAKNVDLGANYWGGNAPTVADGGDLYLATTEGVTYATYAESYALIEGTGPGVTVTLYVPPVAQIGAAKYASLEEAIAAAQSGGTIELLSNYTMTNALNVIGKSLDIDLGGNTLKITENVNRLASGGVTTTIENGVIDISGVGNNSGTAGIFSAGHPLTGAANGGNTINISNVTLTGTDYYGHSVFQLYANCGLNIEDSTVGLTNCLYTSGGFVKSDGSTYVVPITIKNSTVDLVNTQRGFIDGQTVIVDSTMRIVDDRTIAGGTVAKLDNGFNYNATTGDGACIAITNSFVTISGGTGRGITLNGKDVIVAAGSTLAISNMGEGDFMFKKGSGDNVVTASNDSHVTAGSVVLNSGVTSLANDLFAADASSTVPTFVAQIGNTPYTTLASAILAAQSGGTIKILDGTWGADAVGTMTNAERASVRSKSLTIQAAEGATPKFTADVYLGYDDNHTANATMTVTGLAFESAQFSLVNYVQATVEDCSFTGSGASAALYVGDSCDKNHLTAGDYPANQVTIKNCTINGTAAGVPAIRVRNSGNVTITGNTVANSSHNGILLESNSSVANTSVKTVVIQNNTITEWNASNKNDGGRGIRLDLGGLASGSTVTVTGNTLSKTTLGLDTPDFAKITGVGSGTVDLSGNDWNDMLLSEVLSSGNAIYTCDVTPTLTSVITTKFEPVAKIGSTAYGSLKAAVEAAQADDTITLLADDTSLTDGSEITINKSLTITGPVDGTGAPLYTIYGKNTVTDCNDIFITGNGTVTISNVKIAQFGNNAATDIGHAPVYVSTSFTGTVNLENVYISEFNRGGLFLYGGNFNVIDCYIDCANARSGAFTKGIEIKGTATGTISDTVIVNMERSTIAYASAGIEIYGSGSVVVDGCTILSNGGNHASVNATYGIVVGSVGDHNPAGGSLTVTDTMISSSNGSLSVDAANYHVELSECGFDNYIVTWSNGSDISVSSGEYAEDVYAYAGSITITGGVFTNFLPDSGTGTIAISGGLFDAEVPTKYLAEGYECVENTDSETSEAYHYTVREAVAYVAQIGDTLYETLQAAFDAVQDGETITLLADVTQDDGILFNHEGVSAKLDLNEKTLTVNKGSNVNSRAIRIDNGTLEVYNGTIVAVGAGTTSSNGTGCYGAFRVEANGVLNAHDLSLSNARPWGLCVKICGGEATLTRVTITSSYGGGIEVTEANLGTHSKTGSATLTDCTFTQTGYFDHCSSCLAVSGGSALTINSGTYTSETGYALYVYSSGGVITVNGGTFSGNKDGVAIIAAIDTATYPQYVGGLSIAGGDFTGGYSITSPAYMMVTGGKYSVDPAAYVAANYATTQVDGKYVIVNAVAKIGNKYYATLDAAYDAAEEGDTIQLLADITYGTDREVATWSKAVNLDLGGFTLETKSEVAIDASNGGYTAAAICYTIPASNPAKQVTVSNGTIITAYGAGIYADDPGLELTLSGLTIRAATVGTQTTKEYSSAVRITYGSKVIIESGSYSGPNAIAVSNSGGRYEITGGEFFGDLYISNYHSTDYIQEIKVSNGYFDRVVPSEYIVEGKLCTTKANFDHLYQVVPAKTVIFALGANAPAGATAPDMINYPAGNPAETALPLPTYTSTTSTFIGWKDAQNNTWAKIPAGTGEDIVLTAQWESAIVVPVETGGDEATPTVKVTESWVTSNNIDTADKTPEQVAAAITETLETKDTNGLKKWQNYVLGQADTAKSASVVAAKDSVEETKAELDMTFNVPAVDTGFDVTYKMEKTDAKTGETTSGTTATASPTIDLTEVDNGAAYFAVKAVLTPKGEGGAEKAVEVSVQKTVGVVKVDSAAEWTIVAVPWESLADGEIKEIKASELIHLGNRSNGDELRVYTAGAYQTWKLQDGNWVEPTRSFKATKSGSQENSVADAGDVSIPRGAGVWLKRVDPTAPIYLLGQKPTSTVTETSLDRPNSEAAEGTKAWNLVASPNLQEVDVATLLNGRESTDKIIVPTAGAPKDYTYVNGQWGYDGGEVVETEITMPNGVKIKGFRPVRVTNDTKISGTTGFWYLNGDKNSTGKKINWSTEL